MTDRSEWHSPAAPIRMSISPGPGPASSSSATSTGRLEAYGAGAPASHTTAPLTLMARHPRSHRPSRVRGMLEETLSPALEAFASALGPDAVLTSDEAITEFRDPFWLAGDDTHSASAIVMPTTTEQVQ